MKRNGSVEAAADFTCEFALETAPRDVVHECKRQILDALTGVFAAVHYPGGRIPARAAMTLDGSRNRFDGTATVFASGQAASASNAAFANAQCSIAMDVASNFFFSQGLPGVTVFPALALAERDHLPGCKLLEALIPAYEVAGRVALSFPPHHLPPSVRLRDAQGQTQESPYFGFRWIIFGAAVGVAKISALDQDATANALALAANAAPIPQMDSFEKPSMAKYGLLGIMALASIFAGQLADDGFTGDVGLLDDGRFHRSLGSHLFDSSQLIFGPDMRWLIREINYKRYPVGTHNNQGLHALERMVTDEDLSPSDVISVTVGRAIGTDGVFTARPTNYIDTQFSVPFQCAAIIARRPHRDWGNAFRDPELLDIADRISLQPSAEAIAEFETQWMAEPVRSPWWFRTQVAIETHDRRIERWSDYGSPSDDELADKFRHWSEGVLKPASIEKVIEIIFGLEDVDDVCDLARAASDLC